MLALLVPGFDPTTLAAVTGACGLAKELSAADLLAMIQNAKPAANIAWWWKANATPDIVATPALAAFIWFNPDNDEIRKYNGTDWVLLGYAAQSINGSAIITNTLAASALNIPVGSALKILQINGTATGWQYVYAKDAIGDNTFSISKILNGPIGTWLTATASGTQWAAIGQAYILAQLTPGTIPLDRLAPGPNGYQLTIVTGVPTWTPPPTGSGIVITAPDAGKFLTNNGTIESWTTLPVGSVPISAIVPGTNGYFLGTVAGAVAWVNLAALTGRVVSPRTALPASFNAWYPGAAPWTPDITWAHGLGARPTSVQSFFVCKLSYSAFTINATTIPCSEPLAIGTFGYTPFFTWADATNVYFKKVNSVVYTDLVHGAGYMQSTGWTLGDRWDVQFIAQL